MLWFRICNSKAWITEFTIKSYFNPPPIFTLVVESGFRLTIVSTMDYNKADYLIIIVILMHVYQSTNHIMENLTYLQCCILTGAIIRM